MFHSLISRFLAYANIVAMFSNGESLNADSNVQNDLELFEGDILLTEAQRKIIKSGNLTSYSAIEGGHWPDGIIPYVIVDSSKFKNKTDHNNPEKSFIFKDFVPDARKLILQAIERFHASTCLRFVERKYYHQYYIKIVNTLKWDKTTLKWREGGCSSWIGIEYGSINKGQNVHLASHCFIETDIYKESKKIVEKIGT